MDKLFKGRMCLGERIHARIKDEILKGGLRPGQILPSENELISYFGVSRTTVRTALKILRSEGLADSFHGKGWKIGGNIGADKKKPVAIIAMQSNPGCFASFAKDELKKHGFKAFVYHFSKNEKLEDILLPGHMSGLLYLSCLPVPAEHLETATKFKLPVVCAGLQAEQSYDTVSIDNGKAMDLMVDKFVRMGHKEILFIGTKFQDTSFSIRQKAYIASATRHSLKPRSLIFDDNWISPEEDSVRLIRMIRDGKQKIDAVLAVNEVIAKFALILFSQNGINIPEDLSLACIGDIVDKKELSHYGIISMSSVINPWKEISKIAVAKIVSRLNGDCSPARLELANPEVAEADSIKDISTVKAGYARNRKEFKILNF